MATKTNPSLFAFPMHGQRKLLAEGYRTRDGHLIEWFGKLLSTQGPVGVVSRPEPQVLRPLLSRQVGYGPAENTVAFDSYSWHIPSVVNRRRWWMQSRNAYPSMDHWESTPVVIWNPLVGLSNVVGDIFNGARKVHVDLLDDWTIHYAFAGIRDELECAYRRIFEGATSVTANSEGTEALAERFGRTDVELVTNGCDPERFSAISKASGPTTVGYVGKIGNRLDLDLVVGTAMSMPGVRFVFAGPILDAEYRKPLEAVDNIQLLGDVHYSRVPELLETFDLGWVPHRVGDFEVGGDVLKTYEYRAAGLVVLSTPVAGAGKRGLHEVHSLPADEHAAWIRARISDGPRIERVSEDFPEIHTWQGKSSKILSALGITL